MSPGILAQLAQPAGLAGENLAMVGKVQAALVDKVKLRLHFQGSFRKVRRAGMHQPRRG